MTTFETMMILKNMSEQNKERIHWIDVMKGLLILLVVFHHIPQSAMFQGFNNDFWMSYDGLKRYYCCWFMASFFIVTGLCSNFNRPFKDFFISSFKTIVLPAIIIHCFLDSFSLIHNGLSLRAVLIPIKRCLLLGNDWFLTSLFLARLWCWFINKFISSAFSRLIVGCIIMALGFLLHDLHVPNVCFSQHSFAMTIFLLVGQFSKNVVFAEDKNKKRSPISFIEWSSLICLFFSFALFEELNMEIPALNSGFKVSFVDIPLYLFFSILGTAAVITLSKCIACNKILEYIGKNTIVIYLFHVFILRHFLSIFRMYDSDWINCFFVAAVTFMLTIMFCLVLSFLINTKYLKFIIGKF